jgi:hypothetical protein
MATNLEPVEELNLPPVTLAFIIDGEVVTTMHTDERMGAIFQSQPVVVPYSKTGTEADPRPGDLWDGEKFIKKSE